MLLNDDPKQPNKKDKVICIRRFVHIVSRRIYNVDLNNGKFLLHYILTLAR